jgi:heme A synthase
VRQGGPVKQWGLIVVHLLIAQVVLGVATVMNAAPLDLSLVHQGLAAALWLSSVAWLRVAVAVRYPSTAPESLGAEGRAVSA